MQCIEYFVLSGSNSWPSEQTEPGTNLIYPPPNHTFKWETRKKTVFLLRCLGFKAILSSYSTPTYIYINYRFVLYWQRHFKRRDYFPCVLWQSTLLPLAAFLCHLCYLLGVCIKHPLNFGRKISYVQRILLAYLFFSFDYWGFPFCFSFQLCYLYRKEKCIKTIDNLLKHIQVPQNG
jgi:hypothetical protein